MKSKTNHSNADYSLDAESTDHGGDHEPRIFKATALNHKGGVSRRGFMLGAGAAAGAATTLSGCGDDDGKEKQRSKTCNREIAYTDTSGLNGVAYSGDGSRLATAGKSMLAKVWDAQSGDLLITFTHTAILNAVALSPDGSRLASGGDDQVVKVWDIQSGMPVTTYEGHGAAIVAIAFGADGQSVISAAGNQAHIWDAHTGEQLRAIPEQANVITDLSISPDGNNFITCVNTQMARVWDYHTADVVHKGVHTFDRPTGTITTTPLQATMTISGTGLTVSENFNIDVATTLINMFSSVQITSPAGTTLTLKNEGGASGFLSGNFPNTYTPVESLDALFGEPVDGTWTLTVAATRETWSGALTYWAISQQEYQAYNAVAFGQDGHLLAATIRGEVIVWDYRNGEILRTFTGHDPYPATDLAVSPDGNLVVSATNTDTKVWDYHTMDIVHDYTAQHTVNSIAFHPNQNRVFTGDPIRFAHLWEASNGELIHVLRDPDTASLEYGVYCESGSDSTICSCDTVCSCDSVCSCNTVCTCDAQGGGGGGHYWYPN